MTTLNKFKEMEVYYDHKDPVKAKILKVFMEATYAKKAIAIKTKKKTYTDLHFDDEWVQPNEYNSVFAYVAFGYVENKNILQIKSEEKTIVLEDVVVDTALLASINMAMNFIKPKTQYDFSAFLNLPSTIWNFLVKQKLVVAYKPDNPLEYIVKEIPITYKGQEILKVLTYDIPGFDNKNLVFKAIAPGDYVFINDGEVFDDGSFEWAPVIMTEALKIYLDTTSQAADVRIGVNDLAPIKQIKIGRG